MSDAHAGEHSEVGKNAARKFMKPVVGVGLRGPATSLAAAMGLALIGCAGTPLVPFTTDTPPLVLAPATQAGVQDKRGRFREIYCAVLQARAGEVPDHRSCDDALTRLGTEPAGTGQPVPLGASSRRLIAAVVPGIGWDCIAKWLEAPGTVNEHVRKYGYELRPIKVDALSSSDTKRAPGPRRRDGDGPGPGSAAPRAGRLFEGHARCLGGDRQLSGDPPAGGCRGEHRGRGGRLCAGQRRRAVPGRPAAPLSRRDLRLRGRRRSGQPAHRRAQGLAGAEPAAERACRPTRS